MAKWAVLLTGTLFGGKASDLYRLLRWTSPELRRMGLGEKEFVEQYGYAESVEIVDEKRSYGRRVTRSEFRECAGVSPAIYRFLLGRTAFGALRDVAAALPGYKEERVEIAPPDLGVDHIFTHSYGGRLYHEQGKRARCPPGCALRWAITTSPPYSRRRTRTCTASYTGTRTVMQKKKRLSCACPLYPTALFCPKKNVYSNSSSRRERRVEKQ